MPKLKQRWMISYSYRVVFATGPEGGTRRQEPTETVLIVEQPPWKFLAQSKLEVNAAAQEDQNKTHWNGKRLPDEIQAVYWAVELPIGALTEEEIDVMS